MNVIVVDDIKLASQVIENVLSKVEEVKKLKCFLSSIEALEFTKTHPDVNMAFLDIEMPKMNGLELARKLKEINPDIYIIFTTGYSDYALDAFKLKAGGYLLKPISKSDILREIEYAKEHELIRHPQRVRIQTFGNFEIFVDEKILKFTRSKAKELLAILIDHDGASLTSGELIGFLWEDKAIDKNTLSLYQNVVSSLMHSLKEAKVEDIIIKSKNNMAVDKNKVNCDYYGFLKGNKTCMDLFRGEYMMQYSWAEATLSYLENKINKNS